MSDLNVKDDLSIDALKLDEEIKYQPGLYYQYAEELANEKAILSKLELQLEVKIASLAQAIRTGTDPRAANMKVTESAIQELINTDKEVIDGKIKVGEQKTYVQKLASAVEAFSQRKAMLVQAVSLWIAGYYAGNIKPNEGSVYSRLDDEKYGQYVEEQTNALNS